MRYGRVLATIGLLALAPPVLAYDKGSFNITKKTIDTVVSSTYRHWSTIGSFDAGQRITIKNGSGSGVILLDKKTGDQYYLTAAHTVASSNFTESDAISGVHTVNEINMEIVKMDEEQDLALLKIDGCLPNVYKGRIVGDYELGDLLLSYGYSGVLHDNGLLKEGRIGNESKRYLVYYGQIQPGDSGSPIYALDFGEPVMVGINVGIYRENPHISLAVSGENVLNFLKGTILEDDYVTHKNTTGENKKGCGKYSCPVPKKDTQ